MTNTLFGQAAEKLAHSVVASTPVSKMTFTPNGLEFSFVYMPAVLRDMIAVPGVQFPPVTSQRALDQYKALTDAGLTMGVEQMQEVAQKLKDQAAATEASIGSTPTTLAPTPAAGQQAIAVSPEAQAMARQALITPSQQAVIQETTAAPHTPGKWTSGVVAQRDAAQPARQI
jgi:hypothetical protein